MIANLTIILAVYTTTCFFVGVGALFPSLWRHLYYRIAVTGKLIIALAVTYMVVADTLERARFLYGR